MQQIDRRSFTALSGIAALGGALGIGQRAEAQSAPARRRALRFAHFTDLHITPDRDSEPGMKLAFEAAQADGIEMILTGGDLIMDGYATKRAQVDREWALLHRLFAEHCKVPVEHCLGNHDIFGFCRSKAGLDGSEADYGYARSLAELKLAQRWRSFDRNGWHFVVLSSVEPDPSDECKYLCYLNSEQRAWLEADLASTVLPTVVVSHVPIVTITPVIRGENIVRERETVVTGDYVHLDSNALHGVFRKSGRVKLVLSGHTHLIDRCEADGVTYCCGGAVCGGWWKPTKTYCEPTYGLIDLFEDGGFDHRIRPTGWTNR
ncbi:MAG: metallophosphoesterase family protein [Planctomycetota bacterium]